MKTRKILFRALAAACGLALITSTPTPTAATQDAPSTLERLEAELGDDLVTHTSGDATMVRAEPGVVLAEDDASRPPEDRALAFLADHGDAIGLTDAERDLLTRPASLRPSVAASELRPLRTFEDTAGKTHVRLEQFYKGLHVFGAQVIVHMDDAGITGVNGAFVPNISLDTDPALTADEASDIALGVLSEEDASAAYTVTSTDLAIYRVGLISGRPGTTVLAYAVEVHGAEALQLWIDADDGRLRNRIHLHEDSHQDKHRTAYTPDFEPDHPELFVADDETFPVHNPIPFVANLFRFTGQTFDLFEGAFGFTSYDDGQISGSAPAIMRTVALMNDRCPNAYWDGYTTNYCPGFDLDDVVGHEWGHAYTDHTSDLIYQCQPGALNESYSDIWGEVVDLLNDEDGIGGSNNEQPYPAGQRWLIGEDLTERVHRTLSLRDMWDPERMGHPARVGSTRYTCGPADNGGVHTNSEIPNHLFAMLTDGKTFNGVTVEGIGLAKASHIHFGAQAAYEIPTTKFPEHAQALRAACDDLLGIDVADLSVGTTSTAPGGVITSNDCAQVDAAITAVELEDEPFLCRRVPLLKQDPPAACENATTVFAEDFEDGLAGWELSSEGAEDPVELEDEWPGYNWEPVSDLPQDRAGTAAYAINERAGNCRRGPDISGHFTLDSPTFTLAGENLELRFDHYVATRRASDGGNLKVSVNGGPFELVSGEHYLYNGPNLTLEDATVDGNSNPLADEIAWSGMDQLAAEGTWGTTVLDLDAVASAGDEITLRFDFGVNCAGGVDGWYVDDIVVTSCAATDPTA